MLYDQDVSHTIAKGMHHRHTSIAANPPLNEMDFFQNGFLLHVGTFMVTVMGIGYARSKQWVRCFIHRLISPMHQT